MMVTFISQCEKKALTRTRKVLDAFADRIGTNTWQTVITQEGLLAVKKSLRKTATKNTAVSCHWIRSRSRSELVWVVGNRSKFNDKGIVPVNRTRKNLLHSEWESAWVYADSIQILAVLAALLHDLGKATIGFQKKLIAKTSIGADPYRHEWISLRLFEAIITGCKTDQQWLERFSNIDIFLQDHPQWHHNIVNDSEQKQRGVDHLPPIAQLIAWLIVTHHRLPFYDQTYTKASSRYELQRHNFTLKQSMARFYKQVAPINHWVRNEKACNEHKDQQDFWQLKANIANSDVWQKTIKRWANKALLHNPLMALTEKTIADPLLMHMSRLCLMVGDHNYSSLAVDDKRRVTGDAALKNRLIANTDFSTKSPKQSLDEHLLGVANFTARFSKLLPQFSRELPTIISHAPFTKRTPINQFKWQNNAFDLVKKSQTQTDEHGFFGVNMASTGCGKTLGNARIMAAISSPEKGVRFTVALGLRVLTLQTGMTLREKLHLDETSLAIIVGGVSNRRLFELQQEAEQESLEADLGSESMEALVKEVVNYDECLVDSDELGTVIADKKAHDLLYAPIVSCTVDHIIGATETLRGGKYIAPMLRLLSSDLILDEPDDFDQNDLPALSRLVYMAGMLGSKVLLSSATLTPDLITGLFEAYRSGRAVWHRHHNKSTPTIVCAWIDEFNQRVSPCADKQAYQSLHDSYIKKRVNELTQKEPRRIGHIVDMTLPSPAEGEKVNNDALANALLNSARTLHTTHHMVCPNTHKTASIGLIRFANISPMVDILTRCYQADLPDDTAIHICCYHARQLLLLRNSLEVKLDRILHRTNTHSIFEHPEISSEINRSNQQHHIFIVLASPVAEVGRDHDYDWAIVEPSSMRSIIQLAGRIWRHRPQKVATEPNIHLLNLNIKALSAGSNTGIGHAVFTRPGFESREHLLNTHQLNTLITEQQLSHINAIPRIQKNESLIPTHRLADLEHCVMEDVLNNPHGNYVSEFWQTDTANHANAHIQRISPFRLQEGKKTDYVCMVDDEQKTGYRFRYAEKAWDDLYGGDSINSIFHIKNTLFYQGNISPWLTTDVETELTLLANRLNTENYYKLARDYATVTLACNDQGDNNVWNFHPWIGFWQ